jgi:hypothetical protein
LAASGVFRWKLPWAATAIRATPERIWSILTDAERYPSWNTTVDRVEGRIRPGEKIKLYVKLSPGRAFPVAVKEFVPPGRMIWPGGMPLGLFKGERTFSLAPISPDAVEFSMTEVYSGLLSPLIEGSLPEMQPAFEEFALRLKERAEKEI